ncbi:MAG: PEP-CTERM sorting domain-containing protein [Planctomycetota bacterium]
MSGKQIGSGVVTGILMLGAAQAYANGVAVPDVALSTTQPAGLNNVNFEDDALVGYDPVTNFAVQLFDLADEFGIARDLDAAHELPNGDLIVSTQAGGTFGGLTFTESDLLELDRVNGTASVFLDASAIGLTGLNNTVPNINAVHVRADGTVLFSTASNDGVTLGGNTFSKDDVIAYDPVGGTANLFFDGSLITGGEPDLLAFAEIDADHVLLAASNEGSSTSGLLTLGGLTFSRDDLVLYNTANNTSTLFLEGLVEFDNPGEIIDAVTPAVVPEPNAAALLGLVGLAALRRR